MPINPRTFARWGIRPPVGTPINRASPLARDLAFLLDCSDTTGGIRDAVSGKPGVVGTTTKIVPTSLGNALDFDKTVNSAVNFNGILSDYSGNVGTVFMLLPVLRSYDSHGFVLWGTQTGAYNYWQFFPTTDFQVFGGGVAYYGGWSSLQNAGAISVVLVSDGVASIAYVNGVQVSTSSGGTPTAMASGGKDFKLGGWWGGAGWSLDGQVVSMGMSRAVWGPDEAALYARDPFQLFAPPRRIAYQNVPPAPNTNGATLTGVANLAAAAVVYAACAMSGGASLGSSAQVQPASAITGVATLGATAQVQPSSSLTGVATLHGAAQVQPAAALAGVGSLGSSANVQPAAALTGVANLGSGAQVQSSAAITGVGNLGATVGAASLSATLTGVGNLGAAAQVQSASAETGVANLTAQAVVYASANLSGVANLGGTVGAASSAANLTGVGSLSGSASVQAAATLSGVATLTAQPSVVASAALAGGSALSGSASVQSATTITGVATLSGTGTLVNPGAPTPLRATRVFAGPLVRVTRVQTFPN